MGYVPPGVPDARRRREELRKGLLIERRQLRFGDGVERPLQPGTPRVWGEQCDRYRERVEVCPKFARITGCDLAQTNPAVSARAYPTSKVAVAIEAQPGELLVAVIPLEEHRLTGPVLGVPGELLVGDRLEVLPQPGGMGCSLTLGRPPRAGGRRIQPLRSPSRLPPDQGRSQRPVPLASAEAVQFLSRFLPPERCH